MLMKSNKRVNTITIINIISTLFLQGITFISAPIISRMLGPDNYGIASVYITWVGLFSTVFGLQTQSTIALARKEYTENKQLEYQSSILLLSILSYILFSVVVFVVAEPVSQLIGLPSKLMFLVLMQGLGQYIATFFNIKYTYEFKAIKNLILTIIVSVSTFITSVLLINCFPSETNYYGRIFGQMIPYTLIGVTLCIYFFISSRPGNIKEYWKFCLPLCIPIIFHNLSNLLLNQSSRVLLKMLLDNSSAGIYSLAYSFGAVLSTVWTALNNSWTPFYYELSNAGATKELKTRAKNYTELFTILAIGFVLLSTEVFHIFAAREFWDGSSLIDVFAVGFYCMFLYSFPVNFEFYHKKTKLIAIGTALASVCNIALNIVLISKIGIFGAAFATTISYLLQFIFHHICATKIIKSQDPYPFKLTMFVPYVMVFMAIIVAKQFLVPYPIVRWAMGILLGLFEIYRIIKRKAIF